MMSLKYLNQEQSVRQRSLFDYQIFCYFCLSVLAWRRFYWNHVRLQANVNTHILNYFFVFIVICDNHLAYYISTNIYYLLNNLFFKCLENCRPWIEKKRYIGSFATKRKWLVAWTWHYRKNRFVSCQLRCCHRHIHDSWIHATATWNTHWSRCVWPWFFLSVFKIFW